MILFVDAPIPCPAATQHSTDRETKGFEAQCLGPAAPESTNITQIYLSPPVP